MASKVNRSRAVPGGPRRGPEQGSPGGVSNRERGVRAERGNRGDDSPRGRGRHARREPAATGKKLLQASSSTSVMGDGSGSPGMLKASSSKSMMGDEPEARQRVPQQRRRDPTPMLKASSSKSLMGEEAAGRRKRSVSPVKQRRGHVGQERPSRPDTTAAAAAASQYRPTPSPVKSMPSPAADSPIKHTISGSTAKTRSPRHDRQKRRSGMHALHDAGDSRAQASRADGQVKLGKSESQVKLGKSDSQVKLAKSDSQVKLAKSDSQVKLAKSDSQVKMAKSDSHVKLAKSDSQVKLAKSDSQGKLAKPDSQVKLGKSDSQAKVTKPDSQAKMTKSDDNSPIPAEKKPLTRSKSAIRMRPLRSESKSVRFEAPAPTPDNAAGGPRQKKMATPNVAEKKVTKAQDAGHTKAASRASAVLTTQKGRYSASQATPRESQRTLVDRASVITDALRLIGGLDVETSLHSMKRRSMAVHVTAGTAAAPAASKGPGHKHNVSGTSLTSMISGAEELRRARQRPEDDPPELGKVQQVVRLSTCRAMITPLDDDRVRVLVRATPPDTGAGAGEEAAMMTPASVPVVPRTQAVPIARGHGAACCSVS